MCCHSKLQRYAVIHQITELTVSGYRTVWFLPSLQMENPWHFYHSLWNKEVAFQWQSIKQHDDLIATRVKGFKESPPPEYTIAAHLLSVKDPATGKPLTINKLKGEVGTFMFAGFETTSHVGCQQRSYLMFHVGLCQWVSVSAYHHYVYCMHPCAILVLVVVP